MAFALPAAVVTLLLPMLVKLASEAIRMIITEAIRKAYQSAVNSANPWDNILAKGLALWFSVDLSGIEKDAAIVGAVDPDPVIENAILSGFAQVAGSPWVPPGNSLGGA